MDIYPAFELAVAVITFVLGFVSARHHAQLSAARQLIASMDDAVAGAAATSSRDQAEDLLTLATSGFERDWIVDATVVGATAIALTVTALSLGGQARGWLDPSGAGIAKGSLAVGLAWMVTALGGADAWAVRRGLRHLRDRTTVGLLSQAEGAIRAKRLHAAVHTSTLALTRSPSSALARVARARARVELAERTSSLDERATLLSAADRDVALALEGDERLVAGMVDWVLPATSASLLPSMRAAWLGDRDISHMRIDLRRRVMSHAHGAVRRLALGRREDAHASTAAEQVRDAGGEEVITVGGIEVLRMTREGQYTAAHQRAVALMEVVDSQPPGDVLAAMNVLVVLGMAAGEDPFTGRDLPADHPWRTWIALARADWLEQVGEVSRAQQVLSTSGSDLARLRARILRA